MHILPEFWACNHGRRISPNVYLGGPNLADPDIVLTKLQGVKRAGKDKWRAKCPAHDDRVASLSVAVADDKILIHCHAGCSTEAVVEALGMSMSDLFLDRKVVRKVRREPIIKAVYDYTDSQGNLVYQVVRYTPKGFKQRQPDGKSGWIWNLDGVEIVPYRLPNILSAQSRGEVVYVAEGEKDVHALEKLGLSATTNPGGAGKWRAGFAKYFRDAHLVILPDNDQPGREHAEEVATLLHGVAASIKIVELPGIAHKEDVSDWLAKGHSLEELKSLVELAPIWKPADKKPTLQPSEAHCTDRPLTDLGNAERLIDAHGQNLRFDVDAGKWLVWNGKRWEYDTSGTVNRLAADVLRSLYDILPSLDKTTADALYVHIKKSESQPRLQAMVTIAQWLDGVPVRSTRLDADPMLLNCLNGTLNLRTGELQEHKREDLITKLVPIEYDPKARAPRWEEFLREVFQENEEIIAFVQRAIGYCLTGDTREQVAFVLSGKGSNGKSTFVETLRSILGDYAGDTPFTTFVERRDSNTADLAGLLGKRLVTASEGEETQVFNEGLLKTVTGGDQVTCRHLYREYFTYSPTYKVIFSTNEIPHIRSQNYAMKRRIVLIPFNQRFYDPSEGKEPVRDPTLKHKLAQEKNGIFNWTVKGCLEWQKRGLDLPEIIRGEVNKLFESHDPLAEWLDAECELKPGVEVKSAVLWKRYLSWCEEQGRTPAFRDARWFVRSLVQRDGIEARKGTGGVRLLTGITLVDRAAIDSMSGVSGVKTAFLQNSPMKGVHEHFSENAQMMPLDATIERETDSEQPMLTDQTEEEEDNILNTATWEQNRLELLCWAEDHNWPRFMIGPSNMIKDKRSWLEFLVLAQPETIAIVLKKARSERG